jgi:hypothetical protein
MFNFVLCGLCYEEIASTSGGLRLDGNFEVFIAWIVSEACSGTWNSCANSAFAAGPSKTTGELDRVGRSQDLPVVY